MKRSALVLLFSMLWAVPASAINAKGTVSRLYPQGDLVYFRLNEEQPQPCKSSGQNTYFKFDLSGAGGQAYMALLLSAANTGGSVVVSVAQCDTSIDEYVQYIYQDY